MALFDWFKELLRRKRPEVPEVLQSRELSKSISEKTEILQERLKVYHKSHQPLAALIADLYTRDQVSRIYKNGSGL